MQAIRFMKNVFHPQVQISQPMNNKSMDVIVVFLLFVFAFIFSLNKVAGPDTFWHLAIGRYIVTSHTIPAHDVFSYTLPQTAFYRVEWLFDVIWFIIYSVSGMSGLVLLKSFISGSIAVLTFFSLQHYKVNRYISFFTIISIFFIVGSDIGDRPQIITYLGIILFVFITSIQNIDNKKTLWLIPFIMLLWGSV